MQDTMFIGLDVHKATISVAVAQGERGGEVRHWGTIPNRPDHVRRLAEKLGCDGRRLHFCYEAGPCGYGLHRQLAVSGVSAPLRFRLRSRPATPVSGGCLSSYELTGYSRMRSFHRL